MTALLDLDARTARIDELRQLRAETVEALHDQAANGDCVYWEEMGPDGQAHMVRFARLVAAHTRAEHATLLGRLESLAKLACPDGYAEGYEDAAILSAIRERDDLKRGPLKDGEF